MEIANRPAFGPACMLCYVGLFVATNAVTKSLSASLPVVEIALFRYAVAVPVVIVVVALRHGRARMNSPALHMLRGILAAVGSVCGYFAMAIRSRRCRSSLR
jgi:drug/metabolite transporter (DMT)-like permease